MNEISKSLAAKLLCLILIACGNSLFAQKYWLADRAATLDPQWWTNVLLPGIQQYKTSYVLTWRNWKTEHIFAPYPGQASAADFKKFYANPVMIFQNKLQHTIYTKYL